MDTDAAGVKKKQLEAQAKTLQESKSSKLDQALKRLEVKTMQRIDEVKELTVKQRAEHSGLIVSLQEGHQQL